MKTTIVQTWLIETLQNIGMIRNVSKKKKGFVSNVHVSRRKILEVEQLGNNLFMVIRLVQ